jgi:hypothetical protein
MAEDDAVDLNAQIEAELTPYASLDLDAEWVAYLSQSAEIPTCVAGVDPNINYEEGDGDNAVA